MTGFRSESSIREFWDHCSGLEEWCDHPCLSREGVSRSRTKVAFDSRSSKKGYSRMMESLVLFFNILSSFN